MKNNKWNMTRFERFKLYWLEAWIELIISIIWIITLAQYRPNWDFKYIIRMNTLKMNKRIKDKRISVIAHPEQSKSDDSRRL